MRGREGGGSKVPCLLQGGLPGLPSQVQVSLLRTLWLGLRVPPPPPLLPKTRSACSALPSITGPVAPHLPPDTPGWDSSLSLLSALPGTLFPKGASSSWGWMRRSLVYAAVSLLEAKQPLSSNPCSGVSWPRDLRRDSQLLGTLCPHL